jgi:hypothetical protein
LPIAAVQQLEEHLAEPEVKKPWVQPSEQDKPTGEDHGGIGNKTKN